MPAILVWLLGGLASMLSGLVPRILLALGIGFTTYAGIDLALDAAWAAVESNMAGLPVVVLQVLSTVRVDEGLTMVASAIVGVVGLRAVSGTITRLTLKGVT